MRFFQIWRLMSLELRCCPPVQKHQYLSKKQAHPGEAHLGEAHPGEAHLGEAHLGGAHLGGAHLGEAS
jgi:hypothetical protein